MMWRSRRPGNRDEALLDALADRLRRIAASVNPRTEFQSSLRTSLTMEASTALVPDPSQQHAAAARTIRVLPRRRMAVATAVVGTALGLGSMASASASALPGEGLYPVKRVTEKVELAFHRDLEDRGAFKLELAERRLDEARELSARGPEFSDLAAESVREFEESAADGTADLVEAFRESNTPASMVLLNRFAERTDARLDLLAAELPEASTGAVDQARESLDEIGSRTEQLCPTCSAGPEGPKPSAPGGSVGPGPAPEPEPEPEPDDAPPAEQPAMPTPPAPVSAPSEGSSTSSEDEDEDDDEDEDEEDSDDEIQPSPTPTPEPSPTPTPEPSPTTPEPSPTPTPEPTEPTDPATILDIVPAALEGVGSLLEGALGGLQPSGDPE